MKSIIKQLILAIFILSIHNLFAQQEFTDLFSQHPSSDLVAVTMPGENAKLITPLFNTRMKDISIAFGGDGYYYLTGTVIQQNSTGVLLWKSKDLREWTVLGVVYDDGDRLKAPEIHFIRNNFYIVIAKSNGCIKILKSKTQEATGPYEASACLVENGTDPSLFVDDDNKVYLLYGNGYIARLTDDLQSLAENPRFLKSDKRNINSVKLPRGRDWPVQNRVGKSGVFMVKIKGKYYLFANEITGRMKSATDDMFIAVADHIYGPYSLRYFALPHASQTCLFRDEENNLWATFSGHALDRYAAFNERPGIVPLAFSPQGQLRPAPHVFVKRTPVAKLRQKITSETLRDPSITLGPDGYYYLVGTNDGYGYTYQKGGIKLWRSKDLDQWEDIGFAWTWDDLNWTPPEKKAMLWAPEIKYVKTDQNFCPTFNLWLPGGITFLYKSTTGKAEGPYINAADSFLVRGIDGFIFEGSNNVYFLWGGGRLGKLKSDRSGFEEDTKRLLTVDSTHVGYEGNCLIKIKEKYILSGAEWNGPLRTHGTYDMMYGISDDLWGPYTTAAIAVPHAGHGTVFQDKNGNWWTTMFGNDKTSPWRMHFGLVPLEIGDGFYIRSKD